MSPVSYHWEREVGRPGTRRTCESAPAAPVSRDFLVPKLRGRFGSNLAQVQVVVVGGLMLDPGG